VNTDKHHIIVRGLSVEVVRKNIKNLHLGVYPPHGRVRVAVPRVLTDEAVRLAVINKFGWIKRQRAKFEAQPRQSEREYVSGESHYFLGKRYRLRVHESDGRAKVVLRGKASIDLFIRPETNAEQRALVINRWYRQHLRTLIPPLLDKWKSRLKVEVSEWGIKKMKTKWGSCNVETGRVWLNLELAKKPVQCLEYIVVHELVHLIEPKHNGQFAALMDKHMPNWRIHKDELNSAPLAHDTWSY
jgi:predicted metal-dependent hydrolase